MEGKELKEGDVLRWLGEPFVNTFPKGLFFVKQVIQCQDEVWCELMPFCGDRSVRLEPGHAKENWELTLFKKEDVLRMLDACHDFYEFIEEENIIMMRHSEAEICKLKRQLEKMKGKNRGLENKIKRYDRLLESDFERGCFSDTKK